MKTSLSSLELYYLLSELHSLVGAKLEKVFQQEKPLDEFLFTLHLPSKGKQYLFLTIPQTICLSSFKPIFPNQPPHFCTLLRKRLANARIQRIDQLDFERILLINWSTKDAHFNLIIELLSPGNLILCDANMKIIAALHPKKWNTRSILPGQTYKLPPQKINPLTLAKKDFFEAVKRSDKESVVKTLAIDISLGGLYAEELLSRTNILSNTKPVDISEEMSNTIYAALQNILFSETAAFVANDEAFPFQLTSTKDKEQKSFETFNEAVASVILSQLEKVDKADQQKSSKITQKKHDKVIHAQEQQLVNLEKAHAENQLKGELIYSHYQDLQKVLRVLSEERKTLSWKEIKEKYKDNPYIVSFDEKNNSVTVDVPENKE